MHPDDSRTPWVTENLPAHSLVVSETIFKELNHYFPQATTPIVLSACHNASEMNMVSTMSI